MLFSKPKRIRLNVMLDEDILNTLNELAALNGSSRSHLLNELLRPSIPSLNELIDLSVRMKKEADEDKIAHSLKTLDGIESKLTKPIAQIPDYIRGIHND